MGISEGACGWRGAKLAAGIGDACTHHTLGIARLLHQIPSPRLNPDCLISAPVAAGCIGSDATAAL